VAAASGGSGPTVTASVSGSSLVLERVEVGAAEPSLTAGRLKLPRAEASGSKQQKVKQKNKPPTFNEKERVGHDSDSNNSIF